MVKYLAIFSFLLAPAISNAQLLNPSFEQRDSIGNTAFWNIEQGKVSILTAINFGVIPFTAFNGNNFVLLETDTQTIPKKNAQFVQQFALNDTPASIKFRYLYIPENNTQFGTLHFYATKWNGTSRDTILNLLDTIAVVANGNNILLQWNEFTQNLTYQTTQIPDTATIYFSNNNSSLCTSCKLFLDYISFGKWPVGLIENTKLSTKIFPNPVSDFITIEADQIQSIQLLSIDGKEWINRNITPSNSTIIDIHQIPSGIYVCFVKNIAGKQAQQLVTIQH